MNCSCVGATRKNEMFVVEPEPCASGYFSANARTTLMISSEFRRTRHSPVPWTPFIFVQSST